MRLFPALAATVALCTSAPAIAGWEYAQWGQTPEELIAASNSAATPVKADRDERVFKMDYLARAEIEWQGIPLEARFHFKGRQKQLQVVKLIPKDVAQCGKLRDAAVAAFGPGTPRDRKPILPNLRDVSIDWQDEPRGNRMLYADIEVGNFHVCHLIYRSFEGD